MARKASKRPVQGGDGNGAQGRRPSGPGLGLSGGESGTTGRFLVLLREDALDEGVRMLSDIAGVRLARSADFEEGAISAETLGTDSVLFDDIGVAVVRGEPGQYQALAAEGEDSPLEVIEPERIVYASAELGGNGQTEIALPEQLPFSIPMAPEQAPEVILPAPTGIPAALTIEYLHGYRDAIDSLLRRGRGPDTGVELPEAPVAPAAISQIQATWGLQLTRVLQSRFSGRGIKVAVLDTGFDSAHPDFVGRNIASQSFVPGQTVQDLNGHGTHCIGTACGPRQPGVLPRYGVAHACQIRVGKVLNNQGSGTDGWILGGINWAVSTGCRVVSMSLGAQVQVGQPFSQIFEAVARRALARGTLIVAAAGNDSDRRIGRIKPVSHPANCPSILSVAAVDVNLGIAFFSNRGVNPMGGQVDIVGPGVNVHSAWPVPTRYRTISGTSMATPHVTGIAALFAEAVPRATVGDIWRHLIQMSRRLPLPSVDVGAGLVQAP